MYRQSAYRRVFLMIVYNKELSYGSSFVFKYQKYC